jgi:predicted RNase H-like HicB family nuclease
MAMKYTVILEPSAEGFAASVPGLPGCHSQGASEEEAMANIADAVGDYLAVVRELTQGKMMREVEVEDAA